MALRKLQFAGATTAANVPVAGDQHSPIARESKINDSGRGRGDVLLYGGVALGVLAGAAISTYLWLQRVRSLSSSPLDRAEELISSCENKLGEIERAFEELKAAR